MGCGGSREVEAGVDAPLDPFFEKVDNELANTFFIHCKSLVQQLEDMRDKVIDKRDEVYHQTGACSYKQPDILKAFIGLQWKLSADNEGDIAKSGLDTTDEEPYMQLTGKGNTKEAMVATENFIQYCNMLINMKEPCQNLVDKVKETNDDLKDKADKITDQIKDQYKGNESKINLQLAKFNKNKDKFDKIRAAAEEIQKELRITIAMTKDVGENLKDKDRINEVNAVGKNMSQKKVKEAFKIVWDNIKPEERFDANPAAGTNFYAQKLLHKRRMKDQLKNRK